MKTTLRRIFIALFAPLILALFCCSALGCSGGSSVSNAQGPTGGESATDAPPDRLRVEITNRDGDAAAFSVELAYTDQSRALGLMNRTELAADSGMLFLFKDEAVRSFWMKNTLIPLDMLFIGENKQIVDIKFQAKPDDGDPKTKPDAHTSKFPAKYVLEITGGAADAAKIRVGDRISFDDSDAIPFVK